MHAVAAGDKAKKNFGWNIVDPGHGLVFANARRPQDAAAAAALSGTGTYGPLLLLTDAGVLPQPLQDYLLDIQPGYTDDPVRVIQIWFIADRHYRGLEPHYQQAGRDLLVARQVGDASVYSLIGDDSPMDQHMTGRLTAASLSNGKTHLEAPREGEDLFLYVTDGTGSVQVNGENLSLGQYDVILANPEVASVTIETGKSLDFMSFYLPKFLD